MEGLFEIHISISNNDIIPFRLWCLDNDVKAIGILGSVSELTFSKYTNGTSEKAYNKAMSLARNLKLFGIKPIKVRIEAIFSNKNSEIDIHADSSDSAYFEFHMKYHIVNSKDYYELENILKEFSETNNDINTFLGFNSFKKNVEPIVTLRVPSKYKTNGAINYKDMLLALLKQRGFRSNEEIHKEYVFIDCKL